VTDNEDKVRRIEQALLRAVSEEILYEQTDKRFGNQAFYTTCRRLARYRKQSAQELATLFGWMSIGLAYFHCATCRQWFCP
jgi:hypothetical protein